MAQNGREVLFLVIFIMRKCAKICYLFYVLRRWYTLRWLASLISSPILLVLLIWHKKKKQDIIFWTAITQFTFCKFGDHRRDQKIHELFRCSIIHMPAILGYSDSDISRSSTAVSLYSYDLKVPSSINISRSTNSIMRLFGFYRIINQKHHLSF